MLDIEKILLEETKYQGNSEPGSKALSGSDFGNDILQIWYRQKYGVIETDSEFGQNTIGSLIHIAIQSILEGEYLVEYPMKHKMINGWNLTGSVDLLNVHDKDIIDIKTTKQYTVEKMLSDSNHQYIWQLSVYRYLAKKYFAEDFNTKTMFILKDGGYDFRKQVRKPSYQIVEITPKSYMEVEDKFYDIVKQLEEFDKTEPPEKCNDLWWRKSKTISIPVRCQEYCSYNKVCKFYKNLNPMQVNF